MRSRMVVSFAHNDDVVVLSGGTVACDFGAPHPLTSVRVGFRGLLAGEAPGLAAGLVA